MKGKERTIETTQCQRKADIGCLPLLEYSGLQNLNFHFVHVIHFHYSYIIVLLEINEN